MGIQKDEKPPKKNIPKDPGDERTIGMPEMSFPQAETNTIMPIEVADKLDWTQDTKWPQPKWLSEENLSNAPLKTYRYHYLTLLRSRYWRLEGDFRTFYNNYFNSGKVDFVVSRRLIDTLLMAKRMLENDNCDLVSARDLLGVAEQFMVSLYPMHIAKQRAQVLASKLAFDNETLSKKLSDTISDEQFRNGELPALLSEITDTYNQKDRDNLILNSLQVSKLENLLRYGKIVLVLLFITLPLIISFDASIWKGSIFEIGQKQEKVEMKRMVIAKPIQKTIRTESGQDSVITEIETTVTDSPPAMLEVPQIVEKDIVKSGENGIEKEIIMDKPLPQGQHWKKWLIVLAVGILGGVGAFFSGLMSIRKNKIQLMDYQESMINYLLRIIIGAMASMILFVFVSWNAIPGVVFTSAGGILFIAFLSGFSESFFLKQLGVDESDGGTINIQSGATAPASVTPVQDVIN
jgi:hypothetical protein